MADSASYPDERLPTGKSIIRLLRIDRGAGSSVVWRLERVSLGSQDCPNFITASYVWGKPEDRVHIKVDGINVSVAGSVPPILELIRDHDDFKKVERIWIDGICINQNDEDEKNAQVQMMGDIYRKSDITVVWLGKAEKDTDTAMDFLTELQQREKDLQARKSRQTPSNLRNPDKWKSLQRFFSLPWWKRVWTLQEFVIAREPKFYWGKKSIDRKTFRAAVNAIWLCDPFNNLMDWEIFDPAWTRRRIYKWYKEENKVRKKSLLALMVYNSNLELSDERDRIYGVLGLVNTEDSELVGKLSYKDSSDALTLYRRIVKSWVQRHNSLDIICFADLFNSQQPWNLKYDDSLPSWVPDWRAPVYSFVTPLLVCQSGNPTIGNFRPPMGNDSTLVYSASGGKTPSIRSWEHPDQLPCKGILIDIIDGLGGMQNAQGLTIARLVQSTFPKNKLRAWARNDTSTDPRHPSDNKRLLDDIVSCLVLDRKDRYLSILAPVEQFREDFQLLAMFTDGPIDYPIHKAFTEWFRHNKSLLIRGNTLEELCQMTRSPNMKKKVDDSEQGFLSRIHDTTALSGMARRLFTTREGHIGMAPQRAQSGDAVCVLFGCSVPVVLRRRHDYEGTWEFIGECYLHDFMKGEILDHSHSDKEFILGAQN